MHGVGQVLVISWIYENILMMNYLVIMIPSGLITGLVIASLSRIIIYRLKPLIQQGDTLSAKDS
jgi:uncharacterized membrane protein